MKDQKFGPLPVLLLTLAGGIVGFFLRLRMLAVGYDAQGVQIPGSWPFVALWILSGVVVLGLVLICLGMGNRAGLEENFKGRFGAGCLYDALGSSPLYLRPGAAAGQAGSVYHPGFYPGVGRRLGFGLQRVFAPLW